MKKDTRVFLEHILGCIDLEITWIVAKERLPELREQIERILDELE